MLKSIYEWFKIRRISKENTWKLGSPAQKDVNPLPRADVRFRVLIVGPVNAGKTTLLERLSDSPAGAAIVTRNGRRIKEVPRGSGQRGIHNINDEITYASNPGFVFHDSAGFEAGGDREVEIVWDFIHTRSLASPSEKLHAIWLCIPTDTDRPFGFMSSGFFSQSTGAVPIIGIFTKLDGRETKVMAAILGPDPSLSDILDPPPEVKQKVDEFVDGLETQFRNQQYPPAVFVKVENMHIDSAQSIASCNNLLQATINALSRNETHDETPKLLLTGVVEDTNRRPSVIPVLQRLLAGENIVDEIPAHGKDEELKLHKSGAFRTLWLLLYREYGSVHHTEEEESEYNERRRSRERKYEEVDSFLSTSLPKEVEMYGVVVWFSAEERLQD